MAQWILPSDERWSSMLAQVEHDFYHLPCYLEQAARMDHGKPRAFYSELTTGRMLIPLLVRNVPDEISPHGGYLDATSPYGYPGPLFDETVTLADAARGINAFVAFGKSAGLITTFLRLHPFIATRYWSALADSQYVRGISHGATISIDLTISMEELNTRLRKNHRRNIRRLFNLGYSVRIDDWKYYADFIAIYHETMRRRGAAAYYYFDHEYFSGLHDCLGDALHFCSVFSPDGDLASGGLFVRTGSIVQAHLNATAEKYMAVAPSKLMFYEMRNWSKNAGATIFHLGGGVGGQKDSLYLYKRGLGTDEHQFVTIGITHDPHTYAMLYESLPQVEESASTPAFFPCYRDMELSKHY